MAARSLDVGLHGDRGRADLAHLRGSLLGGAGLDVGDHDAARALAGAFERDGAADAAAASGDHGNAALDVGHRAIPSEHRSGRDALLVPLILDQVDVIVGTDDHVLFPETLALFAWRVRSPQLSRCTLNDAMPRYVGLFGKGASSRLLPPVLHLAS